MGETRSDPDARGQDLHLGHGWGQQRAVSRAGRFRGARWRTLLLCLAPGLWVAAGAAWLVRDRLDVMYGWSRVEASVLERGLVAAPSASLYGFEVAFAYSFDGRPYEAVSRTEWSTWSASILDALHETYTPGSVHTVHLRPGVPDELRFGVGWNLSFLLAPAIVGLLALLMLGAGAYAASLLRR